MKVKKLVSRWLAPMLEEGSVPLISTSLEGVIGSLIGGLLLRANPIR